ncbi:hypothetical protein [Lewinella sp. IMCC34191]|uniref:hypothetical protein n=1 Tax=Lewinella sp. IMCC34191 TaxID=2259172 RepID=UPI000E21CB12|nr:hypothetical protein [Lewinella sp. IMCC34191]
MRLKHLSLLLFAGSTLLTLAGAIVKVQGIGTPVVSSYLLGAGFSLLIAACIGLYLAPPHPPQGTTETPQGKPQDQELLELKELELRKREDENLV